MGTMGKKAKTNIKAYGGRYGPGKIHYMTQYPYVICSSNSVNGIPTDEKVTCKRCIKAVTKGR